MRIFIKSAWLLLIVPGFVYGQTAAHKPIPRPTVRMSGPRSRRSAKHFCELNSKWPHSSRKSKS